MEITFSCPECGAELAAEEEWVGEAVECPNCGTVVEVPALEDDTGEDEEAEEAAAESEPEKRKFSLKRNIESDGLPEAPDGVAPSRLPPEEEEEEDDAMPMAVVGADMVDEDEDDIPVAAATAEEEDEDDDEEEEDDDDEAEEKPKGPAYYAIRVVAVILVLYIGYKYGVGPVIFHAMNKSATVVVMSKSEEAYDLTLGWRRLRQRLEARGVARFPPVDVGMPEKEGLSFKNAKTGETRKLKLPLKPGRIVIVNVDEGYSFYGYDEDNGKDQQIDAADAVVDQIAKQQDPVAAVPVVTKLQEIGKNATVKKFEGEVILGDGYRVSSFGVQTGPQDPEKTKDLPVLTHTATQLQVANGSFRYEASQPALMEGTFRAKAPAATLDIGHDIKIAIPANPQVTLRYGREVGAGDQKKIETDFVNVSLAVDQQEVATPKGKLKGRWQYTATLAGGKWNWQWYFEASGVGDDKKTWKVRLTYLKGGKIDTKLEEVKTNWTPPEKEKDKE